MVTIIFHNIEDLVDYVKDFKSRHNLRITAKIENNIPSFTVQYVA